MTQLEFRSFRRWTLYLSGLLGFVVVGAVNLTTGTTVNPGVYILLGGMLGLDSVLSFQDRSRREEKAKESVDDSS